MAGDRDLEEFFVAEPPEENVAFFYQIQEEPGHPAAHIMAELYQNTQQQIVQALQTLLNQYPTLDLEQLLLTLEFEPLHLGPDPEYINAAGALIIPQFTQAATAAENPIPAANLSGQEIYQKMFL